MVDGEVQDSEDPEVMDMGEGDLPEDTEDKPEGEETAEGEAAAEGEESDLGDPVLTLAYARSAQVKVPAFFLRQFVIVNTCFFPPTNCP